MGRKKIIIGIVSLVLAAVLSVRIWFVNKNRENIIIEKHYVGEEVAIGNNIFYDDYWNMQDYTITVTDVELLSYEEYLEKYHYIENESEPLFEKDDPLFPEMIYDVDILVKNINQEQNEESAIDFSNYILTTDDAIIQSCFLLYGVANASIPDGSMSFRLRPNSEMEIHLPCYFQPSNNIFPISVEETQKGNLRLVASLYPVQKEIWLTK